MRLFQPTGDPLKDIPALSDWRGDGLTFVELLRFLPYLKGSDDLHCDENESLLLWAGVSKACIKALGQLVADGNMEFKVTNPLTYVLDGHRSRQPVAYKKRRYKEQRWMPVTIVRSEASKAKRADDDRRVFASR